MNNINYTIRKEKNSNIAKIPAKIGRNEPCWCGSGKKYKNCCMKKDDEKKLINYRLENAVFISDEYFSVNEYIELSGYPLINFDMFLIEILNIIGRSLYIFNKTSEAVSKEILLKMYYFAKERFNGCLGCKNKCLNVPHKGASFKTLKDEGLIIEDYPESMQVGTHLNFFYIEFTNALATFLEEELSKETTPEAAKEVSSVAYWSIIDSISNNCYENCEYNCMVDYSCDAYCKFCSYLSTGLPCPKEGKVSYDEIKASEKDMEH
jgi:hypothetical protein